MWVCSAGPHCITAGQFRACRPSCLSRIQSRLVGLHSLQWHAAMRAPPPLCHDSCAGPATQRCRCATAPGRWQRHPCACRLPGPHTCIRQRHAKCWPHMPAVKFCAAQALKCWQAARLPGWPQVRQQCKLPDVSIQGPGPGHSSSVNKALQVPTGMAAKFCCLTSLCH